MLNLPCHTVRRDRRCLAVAKAVITLTVLVGGLISFGTGPAYARGKALATHDKLLELLVRTLEDVTDIKRSLEEPLPELSETTMLRDKLKGISKAHEIDFKGMHKVVGGPTSLVHGEIQERLRHLFRAYNYVIIESPDATVERVIILGHIETRAISTDRIEVKIVDESPRRISGAKCGSPAGGSLLGALLPVSHDGVRLSSSLGHYCADLRIRAD